MVESAMNMKNKAKVTVCILTAGKGIRFGDRARYGLLLSCLGAHILRYLLCIDIGNKLEVVLAVYQPHLF